VDRSQVTGPDRERRREISMVEQNNLTRPDTEREMRNVKRCTGVTWLVQIQIKR
jgi:hypothetical protein